MRIVLDLQGAQSGSRFRGVGRYSLALAEAIAREAGHHDVWLALSGRFPDSIEPLCAKFANLIPPEQIRVFELPGPVAEMDLANTWRKEAAELLREKFLADLRPDVVHVSTLFEGLADEAVNSVGRLDATVPTAVTLYDLIPLLRPDDYLRKPVVKRCYMRRLQSLKRADLLLAISESSRREAIEALQILPERVVTIGAGLPRSFHGSEASHDAQETLTARYGLRRPFVLYTGGDDPRKNLEGLIAAFALLPDEIRRAHQLAIVCKLPEETHRELAAVAKKYGLDGDLVCPGHVPDEDLRLLYAECSVFVFPSLHEGFGLPILEAMACGAPVIGSNCTSIPEIINRTDALFDPLDPRDISIRMAQVLSNPELRQNLKGWGRDRAKMFTWEASARKALRAFEALHVERKAARAGALRITKRRPLLAFVAPLPPARTGIARYSAKLLPNLARHYQIVCIADQPEVTDPWVTAEFVIRDGRWFEENARSFDRILYQFGDSPSHKQMFGFLERHPGVAVLHDFYLSGVLNWMEDSGYAPDSFIKALYDSHGFSALEKDRLEGRAASVKAFPCNASVLRGSIGIIVHSNHSIELARAWYGDRVSSRIRQVPFLPCPPEETDRGALHLSQAHHPERIAEQYREIIEDFYSTSSQAREQHLVQAIARISAPTGATKADLAAVAVALAANRDWFGLPRILVDVTNLAKSDFRTGTERVTRVILTTLIADPPPGYRVEPVRAVTGSYLYARRLACECLSLPQNDLTDDPLETHRGDIFIGLDWCTDVVPSMKPWFLEQRRHGARIVFVVHDLLPLFRPDFFPPGMAQMTVDWIETVAEVADSVACVSRTVADELYTWLAEAKPQRLQPLPLGYFHPGADLPASPPTTGLSGDVSAMLTKLRSRPSFLMIGTVEPRRGYQQALAAMEQLWAEGVDVNLVIVGEQGLKTADLAQRIRLHPERDNRLFWLPEISDEMLEQLYRGARALLAASEHEGFGLSLIEAAQHGLPIIARDISVFREVGGGHAYYFRGNEPRELADALRTWLSLGDDAPPSTALKRLTWQQSSRQLLDVVLCKRWCRCWSEAKPCSV
jgi:glycosyltransferase involved in cell wall biosynthesis